MYLDETIKKTQNLRTTCLRGEGGGIWQMNSWTTALHTTRLYASTEPRQERRDEHRHQLHAAVREQDPDPLNERR